MSPLTIHTQTVQINNGTFTLPAYVAAPTTAGPCPGIIVLQEIFGVNSHIRDVTERFAREGYVAIAPALYHRLSPGFETGYTPDDIKIGRRYKEQTDANELLGDIQGAIDYLQQQSNVNSAAIGCIGFCFGGHVAYLAATLPDIKVTASFYGAGITTWCPGSDAPTVSRTQSISGTLYGFFGMEDASIPSEQVDQIEAALNQHQISSRIFRYAGAGHGFFCDQRGSYNSDAAAAAWVQVKQLFETVLGR